MKKIFLFVSIAALLASCTPKPKVGLEVKIHNNYSLMNKKFIINQVIDGTVVYADTTKIKKDQFQMDIPYKGQGLLNVSIPGSNVDDIMLVAEEGKVQLDIDGTQLHFTGTPLNDRLQDFYQKRDSVSLLFKQLNDEKKAFDSQPLPDKLTPKMKEELQQKSDEFQQRRMQLIKDNTDRIIAFIKENVDNQVGEYYFTNNYIIFPLEQKLILKSFATPKLKKRFSIKD